MGSDPASSLGLPAGAWVAEDPEESDYEDVEELFEEEDQLEGEEVGGGVEGEGGVAEKEGDGVVVKEVVEETGVGKKDDEPRAPKAGGEVQLEREVGGGVEKGDEVAEKEGDGDGVKGVAEKVGGKEVAKKDDGPRDPKAKVAHGLAIVIMGVSGSGKSTVAEMLAKSLKCNFLEADDFHSNSNKVKMSNGIPLSDEDRIPWLEALRDAIKRSLSSGETVSLACSALKKEYRDILRSADTNYKPENYVECKVQFVCLQAPTDVISERMVQRSKEGKHFMPANLLQSQLDLFHIDDAERITNIDATANPQTIVDDIIDLYKLSSVAFAQKTM